MRTFILAAALVAVMGPTSCMAAIIGLDDFGPATAAVGPTSLVKGDMSAQLVATVLGGERDTRITAVPAANNPTLSVPGTGEAIFNADSTGTQGSIQISYDHLDYFFTPTFPFAGVAGLPAPGADTAATPLTTFNFSGLIGINFVVGTVPVASGVIFDFLLADTGGVSAMASFIVPAAGLAAGTMVSVPFSAFTPSGPGFNLASLDGVKLSINGTGGGSLGSFQAETIPEPSSWMLFGLPAVVLVVRRFRRRK